MLHDYPDIRERIAEEPKWYDEHGVPRYGDFRPELCPNIYADQIVLLRIQCTSCSQRFDVERSYHQYLWDGKEVIDGRVIPKEAHYGDPPRHGCKGGGESMNCDDLAVLQSWRRDDKHTEWMYVNNLSEKLAITDSFGIARCVIRLMKEWGIERVLYFWGGDAYTITLERLAQFTPWAMGERMYFQVPVKAWQQYARDCSIHPEWADKTLTLSWEAADAAYVRPQAQQMAML